MSIINPVINPIINSNSNLDDKCVTINSNGDIEEGIRDTFTKRKHNTELEIIRENFIRYGRHVTAFELKQKEMIVALIVELIIGFLVIVNT